MDFFCNGIRNLTEACADKNISPEELLSKIDRVQQETTSNFPDFQSWPADLLLDYIKKKHHRYVEKNIPVVKQYLEKIGQVHGHNHQELLKIAALFTASDGEMTAHMK